MTYAGQERRIHKVYVTRNTEYHVRRGTCVGVRERQTGRWLDDHLAVDGVLQGGLRIIDGVIQPNAGVPEPGESVFFDVGGMNLVTSPLVAVERPPKLIVRRYRR